ncbi:hypothetical protein F66182_3083 [Fusarium sp. NRRL 66182]|nr:hypothetical protein F66182_3083 [Fusarium sp. NRRL 66182]
MSHQNVKHQRNKSDQLRPDYVELDSTRSWQPVSHQDQGTTAYNPAESIRTTPSKTESDSKHEADAQLPLRKALKKYPKIAAYCLAMTIPVVGWGYDLVIVGGVTSVDSFANDYGKEMNGKMEIPGNWLSLWMGLPPTGAALGAFLGGWLQNRIGRKFSLLVGTIVSIIAIACIFFSHLPEPVNVKRIMLTAGLTIQGSSVGIIKLTCMTWVSENTPTALRGSAMALFPTFTLLGQLIGAVVLYLINSMGKNGYLGAFGSQWILSLGPLILSFLMPESPAHLVRTGQEARALKSATRLFAPKVSPYTALEQIRMTLEEERASTASATYATCLRGTNLRRTLIVLLAGLMPAFFGLELLSNVSIFLKTMGMQSSLALMLMIVGIIAGMLGNAVGFWLLSRTGRRNMTIPSLGVTALLWGAMGVTGFWSSTTLTWVSAGIMIAVIVICGLGCWPASFAIIGETSSLQLRPLTQGLGGVADKAASITLAFLLPMLFSSDKAALGAKTAFVFCGTSLVGCFLSWLWIPEMKGRSAMEIDHMFEMRLPTRKFKGYKVVVHDVQETSPLAERRNAEDSE